MFSGTLIFLVILLLIYAGVLMISIAALTKLELLKVNEIFSCEDLFE